MRNSRGIVRSALLIGAAASAVCIGAPGRASAQTPRAPVLRATIQAWHDSLKTWSTFTEARRKERAIAFMNHLDAYELTTLCRECSKDAKLGVDGAAFMRARFSLVAPGAEELAAMVRDTTLGLPCHQTALQNISARRDRFTQEDGEMLGVALLDLADRARYDDQIRLDMQLAAAYLSRGDRLHERMRARIGSSNPADLDIGIAMARESRDLRVAKLLADRIDRDVARAASPPRDLLTVYGTKAGRSGYDRLAPFVSRGDATAQESALEALCATRDPRAMGPLLEAFEQEKVGTGDPVPQTPQGKQRRRYQWLLTCSRSLEPTVIAVLRGEEPALQQDPALAAIALQIADRASLLGPPTNAAGVVEALRAYGAAPGRDGASVLRTQEVIYRIEQGVKLRLQSGKKD